MKFGIVGTSLISKHFCEALNKLEGFSAQAIYSRNFETGKQFASENKVNKVYTSIEEMAEDKEINAVYIASPNVLHAEQSIYFLNHKKPVLCEKPIAGSYDSALRMIEASKSNKVLLMEAMKTPLMPNMDVIKQELNNLGKIRKFIGVFCQYSSKYQSLLANELPNIFNPAMQAGCTMDIAVYPITMAIHLFGKPLDLLASGTILNGNIDGAITITLKYESMDAIIIASKISNSFVSSEIQGEEGSIVIDKISHLEGIKHISKTGIKDISVYQDSSAHFMTYEIKHFASLIKQGLLESDINTHNQSLSVMKILDEVRDNIGVKYKDF